jgi:DNA repair exonuclease SbcCD ATPase subunit
VVDNAKTSQNFQDLRQEVEDLVENIKRLRTDREKNLTTVNNQVQKHILNVQNFRRNINQHLDKLEEELKSELQKLENKAKTDIMGTIAILKDKENDIVKRQKNIEDITKHASDFQAFFGMREVKSNVTEHERYIQSLHDDQKFTQIKMTCSIDTKIQDILTGVKSFGSVAFQTGRSSVSLVRNKNKQALILTTNDKSLNLKRKTTFL